MTLTNSPVEESMRADGINKPVRMIRKREPEKNSLSLFLSGGISGILNFEELTRKKRKTESSNIPIVRMILFRIVSSGRDISSTLHTAKERMQKIINETVFGQFVKSSALRDNHIVNYAHIEYYELRLPKGRNMSKYEFKELYKLCCSYLGFEHQI